MHEWIVFVFAIQLFNFCLIDLPIHQNTRLNTHFKKHQTDNHKKKQPFHTAKIRNSVKGLKYLAEYVNLKIIRFFEIYIVKSRLKNQKAKNENVKKSNLFGQSNAMIYFSQSIYLSNINYEKDISWFPSIKFSCYYKL